jgi:hypothetical protein
MGKKYIKIVFGKLERRVTLRDRGKDGKLTLKYISEVYVVRVWAGLIWLRVGIISGILLEK